MVNQSNRCVPCVLGSGCGCRSIRRSIALLLVADKQREAACRAFLLLPHAGSEFRQYQNAEIAGSAQRAKGSEPARMPQPLALRLLVLPACHALLLPSPLPLPFPIRVELLDKGGERKTVRTELPPHFSSSRVLHVRFSLPVSLHVEPHKGVMQISKDGGGLHRGDVLRAFTSVSWSSRPVFGLIPLSVQPIRSLFVADGMPANRVFEALAANREDRASDHVKQPPTAWPTRPPARPASARSSSGQPPASASLDQWADFLSAGRP